MHRRRTSISIALSLACVVSGVVWASEEAPPLELVSRVELDGPLSVELQEPPALQGGVEAFRRLYRDPRFPSVMLRRDGAVYAAFRRNGPIGLGRDARSIPSDVVYFLGRPDEAAIARIWPDAVLAEEAPKPEPAPVLHTTPVRTGMSTNTPRMAHPPTRSRRLQALAQKYGPVADD